MSFKPKDRQELNNMHFLANGTGQNASSSSESRPTPWTKSATRIDTPKEGSTKPYSLSGFAGSNPYSVGTWDNLQGEGPSRRNPRTASIIRSTHPSHKTDHPNSNQPPVKRRKLEKDSNSSTRRSTRHSTGGATSTFTPSRDDSQTDSSPLEKKFEMTSIHGNRRKSMPADGPGRDAGNGFEFIDLADDDDDENDDQQRIGKPSSPKSSPEDSDDALRLRPGDNVAEILGVDRKSGEAVFEGRNSNARRNKGSNSYPLPPAPKTEALRKRLNALHDLDSDPIEEAGDFDKALDEDDAEQVSGLPRDGAFPNVKKIVRHYEQNANASTQKRISLMKGKNGVNPFGGNSGVHAFKMGKPPGGSTQPLLQTNWQSSEEAAVEIQAYAADGFMILGSHSIQYTLTLPKSAIHIRREGKYARDASTVVKIDSGNVTAITLSQPPLTEPTFIVINLKPEAPISLQTPASGAINLPNFPPNQVFIQISTKGLTQVTKRLARSMSIVYVQNGGKNPWDDLVRNAPDSPTLAAKQRPRPRPSYTENPKAKDDHDSSGTRLTRSAQPRQPRVPSPPLDELILVYPPTGTGALNLNHGDVKRLDPGEFLNDVLIEFGLKLWLNDLRAGRPEIAERVHVFSSFFFTQLNQKNVDEGYLSVRKWTSKVNLFDKNFIIVPINEHLHWYLAIICYPGRTLQHEPKTDGPASKIVTRARGRGGIQTTVPEKPVSSPRPPNSPGQVSTLTTVQDEQEVEEEVRIVSEHSSTSPSDEDKPTRMPSTHQSGEDRIMDMMSGEENESDAAANHADTSSSAERVTVPVSPQNFYGHAKPLSKTECSKDPQTLVIEEEIDESEDDKMEVDTPPPASAEMTEVPKLERPQIFTFDSLGSRHPHVVKVLTRYLELEAKDKTGWEDPVSAQGRAASVPAQPNYCDCGVYLLHFVEQFMSDPEKFVEHILISKGKKKPTKAIRAAREELWEHTKIAGRRNELKQRILTLSAQWKDKALESRGKGKAKAASEPPAETVTNSDSDIEVLEIAKPQQHKAQRLR